MAPVQSNIVTGSFATCREHIHKTSAVSRLYSCSCIVVVHSSGAASVLNLQCKWPGGIKETQ